MVVFDDSSDGSRFRHLQDEWWCRLLRGQTHSYARLSRDHVAIQCRANAADARSKSFYDKLTVGAGCHTGASDSNRDSA